MLQLAIPTHGFRGIIKLKKLFDADPEKYPET